MSGLADLSGWLALSGAWVALSRARRPGGDTRRWRKGEAMHPLERYLRELRDIRSSGAAVKETSYYGPLANLLNEVGRGLRPRVHCVINIRNQGAGIPDGGLFTPDQLQAGPDAPLARGNLPARGVLEVKGTGEEVLAIARGAQVRKYWEKYRQVLVTNLRDFLLVGEDADGDFAPLERYSLAPGAAAFWAAAATPHLLADEHGERFVDYLRRVLLHAAPLAAPRSVPALSPLRCRSRPTGQDVRRSLSAGAARSHPAAGAPVCRAGDA